MNYHDANELETKKSGKHIVSIDGKLCKGLDVSNAGVGSSNLWGSEGSKSNPFSSSDFDLHACNGNSGYYS